MGRTIISKRDVEELRLRSRKAIRRIKKHEVGEAPDEEESAVPIEEQEETEATFPEATREEASTIPLEPDKYTARLLKYIPVEVIALYLSLDAIVRSSAGQAPELLHWGIFIFGIVATFLYLWRIEKVSKKSQLFISIGAYCVWVFTVGGPFVYLNLDPIYGAIFLLIYTFLIPIFEA